MKTLREEILKNQEYQQELNKWKIVLISSLAAIGIGIGAEGTLVNAYYILLVIPFICIYVDSLFYNSKLRVFAIANFIRTFCEFDLGAEDRLIQKYEAFIHNIRNFRVSTLYNFGRRAQFWSSIIFTATSTLLGLYLYDIKHTNDAIYAGFFVVTNHANDMIDVAKVVFLGVLIFSEIVLVLMYHTYKKLMNEINNLINPIIRVVEHDEDIDLPDNMVAMVKLIANADKKLLMPLCIESFTWNNEKKKKV